MMIQNILLYIVVLFLICLCQCKDQEEVQKNIKEENKVKVEKMEFTITSSAFKEGNMIPKKYTCDDADVSPPLAWENIPEGTKSFAIICDDPDAPMGT